MEDLADRLGANRTVLALSIARMGDALGNSILFIVIPLYVAQLASPVISVSESLRSGILISVFGLVNSLLQPFTGALSDRVGRRKPFIMGGLLLIGLATVAFVFATQFWHLLLMRTVQGIGLAFTVPASIAILASGTEKRTRGASMGVYTTLRMVGLSIGPPLGGLLYDRISFDAAFYAGAAAILVGIVMVQVWVKGTPTQPRQKQQSGRVRFINPALLTPGMLGLGFGTFTMANAFSMLTPLEQQFNTRLNQGSVSFGLAFTALLVSRLIFQIPLGTLSDRRGRKLLIILGLVLMALATAPIGLVQTTWQLMVLRVFQGIASAAIAAPGFALAADLAKAGAEGQQMSIITMGFGLGVALGPLIAGLLVGASLELPFIVGSVIALLGALVVAIYVPETVKRPRDDRD